MIEIEGLVKRFGSYTAVAGLDLRVESGEIFGFLGPNGAGKTTTVKLITGLLKPTAGRVRVAGFDVALQTLQAKRAMGLVPDEPFVYPKLTGTEYLRFVGELYGVPLADMRKRVPELLEMFEFGSWGAELVESYSHGMRQKLVLAGILLHDPEVLVLDEPMVGLDPKSARLVKDIFLKLAGRGRTIFMCTHILGIAEKLCDRIAIMIEGKMAACGTLEELQVQAKKGGLDLEEIFLSLTGGGEYAALLRYL
ncbi:MAG TPA: ABC transporter [Elusimicrobia bacterium]|nr:MAG: ABC transporter [Elusimicrobia bacterium GWA2_66_18]HAZ08068.1 ABC transporter [Elusimicrobiota bacterium]